MLNFNDTIRYNKRITQLAMQVLTPNWNATGFKSMSIMFIGPCIVVIVEG